MFCQKCGTELNDNSKFCSSCGAMLEVKDDIRSEAQHGVVVRGHGRLITGVLGFGIIIASPQDWQWYFDTGTLLAFVGALVILVIGIFMLLLGLFPEAISKRIKVGTKDRYISTVFFLILIATIIYGLEPSSVEEISNLGAT